MMEIKAQEISRLLSEQILDLKSDVNLSEVGSVVSVGDGIARIFGLEKVAAGELLEFASGLRGIALNLEEDSVGAVIMGETHKVKEGDQVKRLGKIAEVPVGDSLLGRVVDALGNPIDGGPALSNVTYSRLEVKAPGIVKKKIGT
jgi:F-type H+/Na+-transporting ATPase subunit alpha